MQKRRSSNTSGSFSFFFFFMCILWWYCPDIYVSPPPPDCLAFMVPVYMVCRHVTRCGNFLLGCVIPSERHSESWSTCSRCWPMWRSLCRVKKGSQLYSWRIPSSGYFRPDNLLSFGGTKRRRNVTTRRMGGRDCFKLEQLVDVYISPQTRLVYNKTDGFSTFYGVPTYMSHAFIP